MTGPNSSTTNKPHDMRRSCLVGAILCGTLVGAATFANIGFSLSLRIEPNLVHVEMTSATAPSKPGGTVHAG